MREVLASIVVWTALAGVAQAADSWGLAGEEKARFEAKVVDIACELTGDCPVACGAGKRQLGLLTGDGRLVLPMKNTVPFAGAVEELVNFCGKPVIVDGLMVTNRGYTFFALQFVRAAPDGEWYGGGRWSRVWAVKNGLAADDPKRNEWYLHDKTVKALVDKQGKLGLGLEADRKFLAQ